ncbi:hypothetical protein AGR7A_Lc140062 [Agrobacterium deltaense NCPPB 1641]|uniref:Uncharacterized protein n=1 Tax=Agrobacterium deltaense NCPPB 1641 TaxID=1183425 RepID=A0A1S7U2M4_9HYPH|nr:hypothetical protein AGR7A_Lc140062 [Agrobacterium deltaense NCPPB 1641]
MINVVLRIEVNQSILLLICDYLSLLLNLRTEPKQFSPRFRLVKSKFNRFFSHSLCDLFK